MSNIYEEFLNNILLDTKNRISGVVRNMYLDIESKKLPSTIFFSLESFENTKEYTLCINSDYEYIFSEFDQKTMVALCITKILYHKMQSATKKELLLWSNLNENEFEHVYPLSCSDYNCKAEFIFHILLIHDNQDLIDYLKEKRLEYIIFSILES